MGRLQYQKLGWVCFSVMISMGAGCASSPTIMPMVREGEYGQARMRLTTHLSNDKSDRSYMLDRMKLCMMDLADGLPDSAEPTVNEAFEILRTQGINDDKTVACVVLNERVKFWKGEPFEQAMMLCEIAVQKSMRGEWDNARAAASASLFLLKDFGENEHGQKKSTEEIARSAAASESKPNQKGRKNSSDGPARSGDYFDAGYQAVKSNFALGYLMNGLANVALDRSDEAEENFRDALQFNPGLSNVVERIRNRQCNTILVVSYGLGPRKIAYGPDRVFSKFEPWPDWPRDQRSLRVTIGSERAAESFCPACDLNTMADDHRWNNMEDVRVAKSVLGSALLYGGVATVGMSHRRDAQIAGLAMMAAGAMMKATASADTRYCEIVPQRVYVAPVTIAQAGTTVDLQIEGDASSRLVLPNLNPPGSSEKIQVRSVRLPPTHGAPKWMTAGRVVYANDTYSGSVAGDELPYILGGRCVRRPTDEVLQHYQQAGYLQDLTLIDLENLYREEGILLDLLEAPSGRAGLHVLEGGDSLVCPMAGSVGYVRLFCQEHPPYRPKSDRVKELAQKISRQRRITAARMHE